MAQGSVLTPREALASIGEVSRRDEALKSRTEGLTWVIWGLANAGVVFTYLALGPEQAFLPAITKLPLWYFPVAGAWVVTGLLGTVGLWRSAALGFRTGMSRERSLAFFLAWPLLTGILTFVAIPFVGWDNGLLAKTVAIGVLLLGFGWWNPLGFTGRGRASAVVLGVVAVAAGALGLALGLGMREAMLTVAAALGGSWVAVGLFAVYRG